MRRTQAAPIRALAPSLTLFLAAALALPAVASEDAKAADSPQGGAAPAPAAAAAADVQQSGKPLAGLAPTTLDQVLAKPEHGKAVRLEGTIDKVCQNKGCWLELKQGEKSVHVTFEDYSFFVAKDSAGKKVVLEGRLKVQEPDPEEEIKHLQGEGAGAAAARRVTVVASGVEIAGARN